jgi:hypothetical protein
MKKRAIRVLPYFTFEKPCHENPGMGGRSQFSAILKNLPDNWLGQKALTGAKVRFRIFG